MGPGLPEPVNFYFFSTPIQMKKKLFQLFYRLIEKSFRVSRKGAFPSPLHFRIGRNLRKEILLFALFLQRGVKIKLKAA